MGSYYRSDSWAHTTDQIHGLILQIRFMGSYCNKATFTHKSFQDDITKLLTEFDYVKYFGGRNSYLSKVSFIFAFGSFKSFNIL